LAFWLPPSTWSQQADGERHANEEGAAQIGRSPVRRPANYSDSDSGSGKLVSAHAQLGDSKLV